MKKETKQLHTIGGYMAKWLLITAIIGLFMGTLSAFFLKESYLCNRCSFSKPLVTLYLPISGVVFTYFYTRFGKNASRGNNLVIEQGNGGEEDIPLRLIPLTLFGTITTHLFGGSVGREGTAVQMGGAMQRL